MDVAVSVGTAVLVRVADDVTVAVGLVVPVGVADGVAVAVNVEVGVGEAVKERLGVMAGEAVALGDGDNANPACCALTCRGTASITSRINKKPGFFILPGQKEGWGTA
jgi:hypothetical protein